MKQNWFRLNKRNPKKENMKICEGIFIEESLFKEEEKRSYTLFFKGVLVYLIVMGSIGSYLSAVDSNYASYAVNIAIFGISIFCAFLFYKRWIENVGYLFLMFCIITSGYSMRQYINSGFYAVVNDTLSKASYYFNLNAVKTYSEQISNRYIAITISMIFIGCIFCIIFNILISRRMEYLLIIPLSSFLLIVPFYMELHPNMIYMMMMLIGYLAMYLVRGSKKYAITEDNAVYQKGKKGKIFRIYQIHAFWQIFVVAIIVIAGSTVIVNAFVSDETLTRKNYENEWKIKTKDKAALVAAKGLRGLFGDSDERGGMNHGKLGNVNQVTLDYNTDLKVIFTPYSMDRLYLKSFVGTEYIPYENHWSNVKNKVVYSGIESKQIQKYMNYYAQDGKNAARGYMKIENIDGGNSDEEFYPYYSMASTSDKTGRKKQYLYYPSLDGNQFSMNLSLKESLNQKEKVSTYLDVPKENYETVKEICEQQKFKGNPDEIAKQIANYFQDNIPYTYSPGETPKNEDFVNYFLNEGRKGYCTHFATAAVLMLRYENIPARYVEGYAIDYDEVLNGQMLSNEDYAKYYDGYSELGKTAVIEVEARDADAHAWVEIYTKEKGWHPVEVTPSSNETAESTGSSFWSSFLQMFGSNVSTSTEQDLTTSDIGSSIGKTVLHFGSRMILIVLGLVLISLCVLFGIRRIRFGIQYYKSTGNDRFILDYQNWVKKKIHGNTRLHQCMNYESQLKYLEEKGKLAELSEEEKNKIIQILEQAGFSNRQVDVNQIKYVWMHLKKKKTKKRRKDSLEK